MTDEKKNTNFVVALNDVELTEKQVADLEGEIKHWFLDALGRVVTGGKFKAEPLPSARAIDLGGGIGGGGGHTAGMHVSRG